MTPPSLPALFRHPRALALAALARREVGAVAALLVVALGVLAFAGIADEMGEGETGGFDRAVIWALREHGDPADPIGPHWLAHAAVDLTSLGSIVDLGVFVLLAAGLCLALRRGREAVWLVAASGGGIAVSQGLKAVFGRARPPLALHAVEVTNASFPSGHAMLSAAVFLTLGVLVERFATDRRIKAYALTAAVVLTLLVGSSRVYLGVHWPTDVLAGWSLGAAWAMAWWLAAAAVERRWPRNPPASGAGARPPRRAKRRGTARAG